MARAKRKTNLDKIIVHIKCSFNNTIVTITDVNGNAVLWTSAGLKFKGSKKGTPFGAQTALEQAMRLFFESNVARKKVLVHVKLNGPGAGKESALRAMLMFDVEIATIADVTPIAHNGCRPRKRRRA